MKTRIPYLPLFELTRGEVVESVHFGAFAIVDSHGTLVASYGDPNTTCYLRSSAKPFQALPLIENGGQTRWHLTSQEIAVMCASHTGTDRHFEVLTGIQTKIDVTQADLLCGVHPAIDISTREAMLTRGETPTPNRHNCSGKHTGMLAQTRMTQSPYKEYIDFNHPIQKEILRTFGEMCQVDPNEIQLGIDGCSAPVFALPLHKAAFGYARLCDPWDLPDNRAEACRTITGAMMDHPDMVSGPGQWDTRLMEVTSGKIVSKGGAEGYQAIGILPGVLSPDSPGVGIAIKISDGDSRGRVRPAVALDILRQLGALKDPEIEALSEFGPRFPVVNWRKITVGEAYPSFTMKHNHLA
jgi:L-asparaginase II